MDLPPKKKPYTVENFKKRADIFLQGTYGSSNKTYFIDLIQQEVAKGIDAGVITMDDAVKFLKERKNKYDEDILLQQDTSDQPAIMPDSYQTEVEGRKNFNKGTEPKTSKVKTDVYKYPVSNRFGTFYAKEPRGNQYTKKSGISLQTDEYKNKIATEIKNNFLRYNDIKALYGRKTADLFKGQYPNVGKLPSKEGRKNAEIKRTNWIKEQSSVSMLQKLSGDKGRGGVQLSHLFSKNVPDSLKTLGYLPTEKNIKSYSKFEKPLTKAIDKVYDEINKKKTNAKALLAAFKDYQKKDRDLRKEFPQYKDTKSRLSFKRTAFDPSGIMIKEKLINPNLAISKEAGTGLKGVMPASEKGKGILSLGAEKLKKFRMPGGSAQDPYKDPLGGPDLIDIKTILRNDQKTY